MCGIAGIVTKEISRDLSGRIRTMNAAIAHRGPDADGCFVDLSSGVALGHRRLSIIDLSTSANQPFQSRSGRYMLVFNGEIYNYREVKKLYPEYPYQTQSDTEVILAAFEAKGPDCVKDFKGMFVFAIWDREEKALWIFRDRMGVKPLYYFLDSGSIYFCSEIRGLLALPEVPHQLDKDGLIDLLRYQSLSTPGTIIQGIRQLPAGYALRYSQGDCQLNAYWRVSDPHMIEGGIRNRQEAVDNIRRLFLQSIERRMVSDVPVGAFLSGGIDSSAVVTAMSRFSSTPVHAFTISFREKEYDEYQYAEVISKMVGAELTRVELGAEDFLQEVPAALAAMDSPSGDGLNTFVVSKHIRRQGIKVALSGVGGDELFVGYPIYHRLRNLLLKRGALNALQPLLRVGARMIPGGSRYRKWKGLFSLPAYDLSHVYTHSRKILMDHEFESILDVHIQSGGDYMEESLSSLNHSLKGTHVFSALAQAEYLGYTQHVLLKDTDQMSMAHALEVREPFFDTDLIEYVLKVPDAWKIGEQPKKLLLDALSPSLPDSVVNRPKMGFVIPYDRWLRKELHDFAGERILRLAGRKSFNPAGLETLWSEYQKGNPGIRWPDIWILVVLEEWLTKNEVNA